MAGVPCGRVGADDPSVTNGSCGNAGVGVIGPSDVGGSWERMVRRGGQGGSLGNAGSVATDRAAGAAWRLGRVGRGGPLTRRGSVRRVGRALLGRRTMLPADPLPHPDLQRSASRSYPPSRGTCRRLALATTRTQADVPREAHPATTPEPTYPHQLSPAAARARLPFERGPSRGELDIAAIKKNDLYTRTVSVTSLPVQTADYTHVGELIRRQPTDEYMPSVPFCWLHHYHVSPLRKPIEYK